MGAPVVPASDTEFVAFMERQKENEWASRWPEQVHEFGQTLSLQKHQRRYYVFTPKMNSACRAWIEGAELMTESEVVSLEQSANGWQLRDSQGRCYTDFDWVFVTAPWPQTQKLLRKFDSAFDLESLWSACWVVGLEFEQPLAIPQSLVYLQNSALQTLVNNSAKPGRNAERPIWVAYLSNAFSDDNADIDVHELNSMVLAEIQRLSAQELPNLVNFHRHYWRFARPQSGQSHNGIIRSPKINLAAGGDWSFGASVQSSYLAATELTKLIPEC